MQHQDLIDDLSDLATRYAGDSAMAALCRESAEAITMLRAKCSWVCVHDRLPQWHTDVLVSDYQQVAFGYYRGDDEKWCDLRGNEITWPTHWMYCPDPPEDE